jgi:hypothetical protein
MGEKAPHAVSQFEFLKDCNNDYNKEIAFLKNKIKKFPYIEQGMPEI